MTGFEKINRSFSLKFSKCALTCCSATSLRHKRRILRKSIALRRGVPRVLMEVLPPTVVVYQTEATPILLVVISCSDYTTISIYIYSFLEFNPLNALDLSRVRKNALNWLKFINWISIWTKQLDGIIIYKDYGYGYFSINDRSILKVKINNVK